MITKFCDLRFDNANNAALSLRILAEHVRSGDVIVNSANVDKALEAEQVISIVFFEPKKSHHRTAGK